MDNTDSQSFVATHDLPWGSVVVGDCLDIAARIAPGSIDLIYADPPFFTKRDFVHGEDKKLRFTDKWTVGGRDEYLGWLEVRVRAMKPLLKPAGVFLLHLDWHAVHYAKVLCDRIFGEECFQNELIWYYQTGGASKGRFSRKHDTILLYSYGPTFYFNGEAIAIPRTAKAMKRAQCATGARIKATDTHKNPDDVLTISALNPMATERTGYPTQKPVELLTRLITALTPPALLLETQHASRPPRDAIAPPSPADTIPRAVVADFFCGSGTTLVAAKRLGRDFVGGDVNPAAVKLAKERIAEM